MIITIDGPTASGKSTLARRLANTLGFYYVATGTLYRALAYILTTYRGYADVQQLAQPPSVAELRYCLDPRRFTYAYTAAQGATVVYEGGDITPYLKTKQMDVGSSLISAHGLVREEMVALQRALANNHNVIVEGRDCGSVVFPEADIKFFITASLEVRAQRWQVDQARKGAVFTIEQAVEIVRERDIRDQTRAASPLVVPVGAYVVDNSTMTLDQTFEHLLEYIRLDMHKKEA